MLGGEFILAVTLNDDCRVGCLVFIFIICLDSRHGTPFAFAWGGMYKAAKMIEANSQRENNDLQRKKNPFWAWEPNYDSTGTTELHLFVLFFILKHASSPVCITTNLCITVCLNQRLLPHLHFSTNAVGNKALKSLSVVVSSCNLFILLLRVWTLESPRKGSMKTSCVLQQWCASVSSFSWL